MRNKGAALYTAQQVRALDRSAIDTHGVPGKLLMERAGRALYALLGEHYAGAAPAIVCGTGNNGGDGFVVARLAHERGLPVRVGVVGDPGSISGDARLALDAALAAGVVPEAWKPELFEGCGVIVDALLGTGLGGTVREPQALAIEAMNRSAMPVLAADIPSGLCSDTGTVLGVAVHAAHTVSFIGRKRGLYTGAAADLRGVLHFDDLGVPAAIYRDIAPAAELLSLVTLLDALGPRRRDAHKGRFGHVLVIGGAPGMGGAALLAAEAAARCGSGLVSVASCAANVPAMLARRPELMVHAVEFAHQLDPLLARASVLVVGPGLGRSAWAQQMLQRALCSPLPLVLDADALNALADGDAGPLPLRANTVLTPHPGEAARLLGCTSAELGADRFAALARLARLGGDVLLKGAGTLVSAHGADYPVGVCPYGNPGMASGGMGDVLSGILGGLLAQGLEPPLTLRLGVCLHARSADLAALESGERGLLAADLMPWLRRLINGRCAPEPGASA